MQRVGANIGGLRPARQRSQSAFQCSHLRKLAKNKPVLRIRNLFLSGSEQDLSPRNNRVELLALVNFFSLAKGTNNCKAFIYILSDPDYRVGTFCK